MKRKTTDLVFLSLLLFYTISAQAQGKYYWQQEVEYFMEIDMDVETHQFDGTQKIIYTNNSPDTIDKVFYHLHFNAFQPGSMMDVRSRTIEDPDKRVGSRIVKLDDDKIGFHKVEKLKQNGKKLEFSIDETIMRAELAEPIPPGEKSTFEMEFHSQVPLQIRRSGRQNSEGIDYSMSQWYPKLAEYDDDGWHPDPYVGREFYGVWGSFDVKINIDSSYVLGGSGVLQNPKEIGHGYAKSDDVKRPNKRKLNWHFVAENVHDFAWAADPDYKHTTYEMENGPTLHFLYQAKDSLTKHWEELPKRAAEGIKYLNSYFGKYPYPQYSVIQAGDGGMEYPMATFITGRRRLGSLVGVYMHEVAHSWYQMVMGTNESRYPWMDEGFTTFSSNLAYTNVMWPNRERPSYYGSLIGYKAIVKAGVEEPMSTHADHFTINRAYGVSSYSKGELFLVQLRYIVGEAVFERGMKRYFNEWKFKHPDPYDFIRIMEKESDLVLDWYLQKWVFTTQTIDYGIKKVEQNGKMLQIELERKGHVFMPFYVKLTFEDDSEKLVYIPVYLAQGHRKVSDEVDVLDPWKWTNGTYQIEMKSKKRITAIEIDPTGEMADIDLENNKVNLESDLLFKAH